MLVFESTTTNPFFNIAAEEYLLKNFSDDCFMVYQNSPSVIVGKHQNTLAEINYQFVKEKNIPVIRRLSGGGTVYHDMGNINFTFIKNAQIENKLVDFQKFTKPIIELLQQLGADAKFEGHNDIRINGLKISGNAEHVFKKRVLHHGTLLFNSDLNILNESINSPKGIFEDKAVKSRRSIVTNIKNYLNEEISVEEFKERLLKYIISTNLETKEYKFSLNDIESIKNLITKKYTTWDWNFGYSPSYNLKNSIKTSQGDIDFSLVVEKGIIVSVKINGLSDHHAIEQALAGIRHNESSVRETLKQQTEFNISQSHLNEIIQGLF